MLWMCESSLLLRVPHSQWLSFLKECCGCQLLWDGTSLDRYGSNWNIIKRCGPCEYGQVSAYFIFSPRVQFQNVPWRAFLSIICGENKVSISYSQLCQKLTLVRDGRDDWELEDGENSNDGVEKGSILSPIMKVTVLVLKNISKKECILMQMIIFKHKCISSSHLPLVMIYTPKWVIRLCSYNSSVFQLRLN